MYTNRSPALFRYIVFAPVSALVACGGGAPPSSSPEPLPKYQSVCAEAVAIYPSAKALASNYHEIALLKASADSADQSTLAAAQRKQAAQLGANGIITGKLKHPKSGIRVIGSTLGSSAQRRVSALAIYVPADTERVRRACGYPGAQLATWTEHSSTLVRAGGPLVDSIDPTRPYNVAPALDEAALARNPNLRWAMATARRVGIATGFFEGHPGILKVTVTESFRSAPALEYTLAELWEAYSEHRPYDEPGVIELWEGDAKVGEYRQNGFSRMTP